MFFPIQSAPYIRLAKRLLAGPGSIESSAYQQEVLCHEETTPLPPAIFLPGQIDRLVERINDSWAYTTKDDALADALRATVTHPATIAYHIKDAILFDGSIYAGRFKYPVADISLFQSGSREPQDLKEVALASSFLGTRYFGHWLAEDCTRYLLAKNAAAPLCLRTSAYAHQKQYQTWFKQDWTPVDRAQIKHLIIFQDSSQNSLKRKRYDHLRSQIKAHFPQKTRNAYVYLKRGQTGTPRIIENEEEIVDALTKRGFVVVDIVADSLEHIIDTLLAAKIVVSIEGSHNQHITLASPGKSGFLVLQPANRFSGYQRAWAECLDIRFGFVVGDVSRAGYNFQIPEILRTVDLMLKRIEVPTNI